MVPFSQKSKNIFIKTVAYLFVFLFLYTSVSKLLDFENFQIQLGQSPMLSAFAGWVSWGIILIELFVSGLLLFDKTRRLGLYLAFVLMVMFTTYIIIILNFSSFVPCSCGGVFEKMGWTEHLIFNIVFLLLAALAFIVSIEKDKDYGQRLKKTVILLSSSFLASVGFVALLFVLSEDIIEHRNNFVRRFPHHPVIIKQHLDLKLNSYYIAGIDHDHIYLGNVTAPLHIRVLNYGLETLEENEISPANLDLLFRSPTLSVSSPYFYFMDGTVPVIFKGKVPLWGATSENKAKAFFTLATPMDSVTFAIRSRDSRTNENILGVLKIGDSASLKLSNDLLVKQIDGVFDTDGTLVYNKQLDRIIYTYFYRNQFIVANSELNPDFIGNTIDTISQAQIKVAYNASNNTSQLAAPPLIVNKGTATYGNYLFVHSGLMGRFEPREALRNSSVIDVYDLVEHTYTFSFYIQNWNKAGLSGFYVHQDKLVCLIGNHIVVYKLDDALFDSSISGATKN